MPPPLPLTTTEGDIEEWQNQVFLFVLYDVARKTRNRFIITWPIKLIWGRYKVRSLSVKYARIYIITIYTANFFCWIERYAALSPYLPLLLPHDHQNILLSFKVVPNSLATWLSKHPLLTLLLQLNFGNKLPLIYCRTEYYNRWSRYSSGSSPGIENDKNHLCWGNC